MTKTLAQQIEALRVAMLDEHGQAMRLLENVAARVKQQGEERNARLAEILADQEVAAHETVRLVQLIASRVRALPAPIPPPPPMRLAEQVGPQPCGLVN